MKAKKELLLAGLGFFLFNISLYLFIFFFHSYVPLNEEQYQSSAHHFIEDSRVKGEFDLVNNLGQYDAQWYLKIASEGYPNLLLELTDSSDMLSYAFFPIYPTTIFLTDLIINDVEYSAFFISLLMLGLNIYSLFFVIAKLFNKGTAIKTSFLLFAYPFSIFYRSYFSESIFLFLLIWFSYFFVGKRYLISSLLLGIMNVTRGSAVFIFIPYIYFLIKDFREKKIDGNTFLTSLLLPFIPLILWSLFVYQQTGKLTFFLEVRQNWTKIDNFLVQFLDNLYKVITFFSHPLHGFHYSKIDVFIVVSVFVLLLLSFKKLPIKLWLISFSIWLSPLIFNDLMSFNRHQAVSFPLFIYLSTVLKGTKYYLAFLIFGVGLFVVSLFFINWHWIG